MIKQNLVANNTYTLKDPDHDEIKDGYQLRWVGKSYAKLQENLLPETVIVPDSTHNSQDQNRYSQNLFLTGDNLEVLKHLEHAYTGKVDMIYIDPPYNTGSDGFVYNDDFRFTDEQLRETLGLTDEEVKRIKNIYGKSSHSAWLTFMYPRLKIAKKLLKDSGVIFVSIDDNEQANLKLLMDEVFNESSFVSQLPRITTIKGKNDEKLIAQSHDYVMIYSRIEALNRNKEFSSITRYKLEDAKGKYYAEATLDSVSLPYSKSLDFPIVFNSKTFMPITYNGKKISWRWSPDLVEFGKKEDLIVEKNGRLYTKTYLEYEIAKDKKGKYTLERKEIGGTYRSQMLFDYKYSNNEASSALAQLNIPFSYSKPASLISKLISLLPQNSDTTILDFFAGSGTTAHAVMDLNHLEGGNRRYILCTLDEKVKEGGEAEKAGYKTIDEIARERIKRAAKQIGDTSGFRHYRFVKPSVKTLEQIEDFDPKATKLLPDDMVTPFSEDSLTGKGNKSGIDTIITTWLIDDGYDFTTTPTPLHLAGYTAYYAPEIARVYLISGENWTKESCKALLNKLGKNEISVNAIVVYSYSFGFTELTELRNNLKANLDGKPELIERY